MGTKQQNQLSDTSDQILPFEDWCKDRLIDMQHQFVNVLLLCKTRKEALNVPVPIMFKYPGTITEEDKQKWPQIKNEYECPYDAWRYYIIHQHKLN